MLKAEVLAAVNRVMSESTRHITAHKKAVLSPMEKTIVDALQIRTPAELLPLGSLCRNSTFWENTPQGHDLGRMELVLRKAVAQVAEEWPQEAKSASSVFLLDAVKDTLRQNQKPQLQGNHTGLINRVPQGKAADELTELVRTALKRMAGISYGKSPVPIPAAPTPIAPRVVAPIRAAVTQRAPVEPRSIKPVVVEEIKKVPENTLSMEERAALGVEIENVLYYLADRNSRNEDLEKLKGLCRQSAFLEVGADPKDYKALDGALQRTINSMTKIWPAETPVNLDNILIIVKQVVAANPRLATIVTSDGRAAKGYSF